jgi:hypothetical protein
MVGRLHDGAKHESRERVGMTGGGGVRDLYPSFLFPPHPLIQRTTLT